MQQLEKFQDFLIATQRHLNLPTSPAHLYDSIRYILDLGGKKVRPILVYLGADSFGEIHTDVEKMALVIELFHNFSLMHDDIMDEADLRRNKPTVHKKWNTPTAILGGDALLVKTYEILNSLDSPSKSELMSLYNKVALEVCEGQQMDMNFESQQEVSTDEYLEMIRLKTAVIMGASLQAGALLNGADPTMQQLMYDFGESLGIAFQLKDDYLDCYGSSDFGKKTGGDILVNKKTYLRIMSENAHDSAFKQKIRDLDTEKDASKKITETLAIYNETNTKLATENAMATYYNKGLRLLDNLSILSDKKQQLIDFAELLWNREK